MHRKGNPILHISHQLFIDNRVLECFILCISQVNYLADDSLEILDDPAAVAMMEVKSLNSA